MMRKMTPEHRKQLQKFSLMLYVSGPTTGNKRRDEATGTTKLNGPSLRKQMTFSIANYCFSHRHPEIGAAKGLFPFAGENGRFNMPIGLFH